MASETTPPAQPEAPAIPGVTRFRKKPIEVSAIQWTGANLDEVQEFCGGGYFGAVPPEDRDPDPDMTAEVYDKLHGTWVHVYDGQWVIRGVQGELYPCAADVFAATYERAGEPLVMPADEFAALRTVAEAADGQPWTPEEIAGFRERFEATMARYAPLRVLPSDHWKDRAEAAEAKLASIVVKCNIATALARASHGMRHPDRSGDEVAASVDVDEILAITGSDEEQCDA